ncbi:trypsin-like peptidase domain-containing protein [Dactylosporangium cerinum]
MLWNRPTPEEVGVRLVAFDPRRLAEIMVTDPVGPGRRGTGYRVTTTTVLTAAHVIAGAQSVSVRFDAQRPTEWAVTGRPEWCDNTTDLAVLRITPLDAEPVLQAGYVRLADVGVFVDAHTAGFPWWKLRRQVHDQDGPFALRDLHHATGRIAVASNRRTGRLEVEVSAPRDIPEAARSPWEGMSGAPLWVADRIVGVIAEHHRHEGPNWLTAIRIDRCLDAAGVDRPELAELLGLSASPNALIDITGTAPSPVTVHTVLPPIAEFTGRAQEILAVTARVTGAAQAGQVVAIHAIDGMPGVGKTALATRLWHLLADQFPQRLFVDLHAHTPGMIPADPADALAGLLRTVGVDPRQLPDGLEQRAALWRERMAGQHTLLVLDNAASSAQVNPLLPGSSHSLVLITSRRHLGDLATTAVDMSLDALPPMRPRRCSCCWLRAPRAIPTRSPRSSPSAGTYRWRSASSPGCSPNTTSGPWLT